MWHYPDIDPIALALGPIKIHWYALTYLVGLGIAWQLARVRRTRLALAWSDDAISDMVFYGALGVVLGGRLGYMLFYGYEELLHDPLAIVRVWQGGMSFHGGMVGVTIAMFVFARRHNTTFLSLMDFVAPCIPLALGCGRIGNFINGELPGRQTEVAWAVIYPGEVIARHPSSLYQMLLEGPVLFAIVWFFGRVRRPEMSVAGLFVMSYGCLRFISEFFRAPDAHLGFVAFDWMSQGQLLSLPMIGGGLLMMGLAYRNPVTTAKPSTTRKKK